MIEVTRLNMKTVVINADLIESIESTPDVVVSLTTGNKIVVRNSIDEIIDKVIDYKAKTGLDLFNLIQGRSMKRAAQGGSEGFNEHRGGD